MQPPPHCRLSWIPALLQRPWWRFCGSETTHSRHHLNGSIKKHFKVNHKLWGDKVHLLKEVTSQTEFKSYSNRQDNMLWTFWWNSMQRNILHICACHVLSLNVYLSLSHISTCITTNKKHNKKKSLTAVSMQSLAIWNLCGKYRGTI